MYRGAPHRPEPARIPHRSPPSGPGPTGEPVPSTAMSPIAGPLLAAALVLGLAGVLKVVRPDPTRVALRSAGLPGTLLAARGIGVAELAVTAYVLGWGGRLGAGLLALAYLGFAGFSALVRKRAGSTASCGCFGASDAPVTSLHVGVDLAVAAVVAVGVVDPVPGLATAMGETPLAGLPFLGFTVLLAWLLQVLLTALPELLAATNPPRRAVR